MENIVTVTGIRPDFIRMSELFKKLDKNFNHSLIHTGQHYDEMMSDVFFNELEIRSPDINLCIGAKDKEHYAQTADLSVRLINHIRAKHLDPDLIIFLGDSNSVTAAVPLKKEGYKIAHIEAGMRSGDKRMLEEINRTVCDHCSDYHFVYHEDYKQNLICENLPEENIFVVGNTIVEVFNKNTYVHDGPSISKQHITVDIHRPENFKHRDRLQKIISIANLFHNTWGIDVYMLKFKRTMDALANFDIDLKDVKPIDLMSYKEYLIFQKNSKLILSDSGTAQEEPALMDVPVVVPRDFTERPQSVDNHCSFMLDLDIVLLDAHKKIIDWLDEKPAMKTDWLGQGNTSELIIDIIKNEIGDA